MKIRIAKSNILPFLGFFLLTVGNGKYIATHYGGLIEYAGLILLLAQCVLTTRGAISFLKDGLKILSLATMLSLGALVLKAPTSGWMSIFFTSSILLCFSMLSDNVLSSSTKIKVAAEAILSGTIFTALIGVVTGTLGVSFGVDDSIVGIIFLSGFEVKNYAGGVWFLIFILYYIYSFREGKQKKFLIWMSAFFLILSGSKGACLLCLLFLVIFNYKKIVVFRARHKKIAAVLIGTIVIIIGVFVYTNIFSNIETYAYRMRGLKKIVELITSDSKRLLFGFSDIAYANTGADYTVNMRNYLGWEASTEMSYVNILIKNGLIGYGVYALIFRSFLKRSKYLEVGKRNIVRTLVLTMLISGFVETYMVSIHYIVGPVLYVLINGLLCETNRKNYRIKSDV